jgi:hypothetical protein
MTGVTINTPADLSPIPNAHGNSKHLIYSTASSTHFNSNPDVFNSTVRTNAFPLNSFTGDETMICPTPRSMLSSASSIFETPSVVSHDGHPTQNVGHSNPRYPASTYQYNTGQPVNSHMMRGHINPIISNPQVQQGQTNLLMSSANYFLES